MENEIEQPESLRDMLTQSVEAAEEQQAATAETVAVAEPEQTPGRTANRQRDEGGRLLPGTRDAAAPKGQAPTDVTPLSSVTPVAAAPLNRPDAWKKEHWERFDRIAKADPEAAAYILQREKEFQSGVSTYKTEAQSARAMNEAIAPFLPNLQRHNMEPTQWIRNLGNAHEKLALGTPQEKVQMGMQLIRDYGIDANALFQMMSGQQAQAQPTQVDIDATVQRRIDEVLTSREIKSEYEKFVQAKDDKGDSLYPHFETVKGTMAGLLQAELAQDYKSAYEAALRHPRHADLFEAMQLQQREQDEAARVAQAKATVNRARSNTVSVKSTAPGSQAHKGNGSLSLRDQLSESFDSVTATRV